MKRGRVKKILALAGLALLAVVALVWYFNRTEPADVRFNGAYRLDDGRLAVVTAREGQTLRIRFPGNGEGRALRPSGSEGEHRYQAGPGWSGRTPVEVEVQFEMTGDRPEGLTLVERTAGGAERRGRRIGLREEIFFFDSGDLALRGKLVLPAPGSAEGPFPAVVLVHGSESYSAVDHYADPYLYAAHGIAGLVFDKRGTGESDGTYVQNFHVLARDVVAAVEALQGRPEIDGDSIHLEGASQGGWIAPLAATRTDAVRSLLIDYGPMVPIAEEDRWGYVYQLRRKGFGEDAIRQADRLHDLVNRALRLESGIAVDEQGEPWEDLAAALDEAEGTDWFEAAKGSDSTVGFLADTRMPLWVIRLYTKWRLRPVDGEPFADRFYDPVPALASLDLPSLWIFGGEDESMPTAWTIDELERLQEAGRPIRVLLYPEADHGILRFEETDTGGRRYLGYEPTYLSTKVAWLRYQSGLDPELHLPSP